MNPLARIPALIAAAAHSVVTEYRRLDAPPPPPAPQRQELNCTAASTQTTWQPRPEQRREAAQRVIGFGPQQGDR